MQSQQPIGLGFLWWIDDSQSCSQIRNSVSKSRWFTENVAESRVGLSSIDLALVFLERQTLSYAALISPTPGRTTTSKKVIASEIVALDISLDELTAALPNTISEALPTSASTSAWRPSDEQWNSIWQMILDLRPELREQLEELRRRRESPAIDFDLPYARTQFIQRDAIGVGLATAGISRKPFFSKLNQEDLGADSVIKLLGREIDEDAIIHYDLRRLADLGLAEDRGDCCVLQKGAKKVAVYNFNRRPEETKLGIDVIYWSLTYGAMTFVQYKMLDKEGSNWRFRPDQHFDNQISAMTRCQEAIDAEQKSTVSNGYRLSNHTFFVKWVYRRRLVLDSDSMAPGLYIPVSYYRHLDANGDLLTQNQARVVAHNTLQRWINRTDFQSLLPWGWIGTSGITLEWLRAYIDGRLNQNHEVIVIENHSVPRRARTT